MKSESLLIATQTDLGESRKLNPPSSMVFHAVGVKNARTASSVSKRLLGFTVPESTTCQNEYSTVAVSL